MFGDLCKDNNGVVLDRVFEILIFMQDRILEDFGNRSVNEVYIFVELCVERFIRELLCYEVEKVV